MTAILGVQCDGCGTADLEVRTGFMDEDRFPKAGWFSVLIWDDESVAGREWHACSPECIKIIGKNLKKQQ